MIEFTLRTGSAGGYTLDHWTGARSPRERRAPTAVCSRRSATRSCSRRSRSRSCWCCCCRRWSWCSCVPAAAARARVHLHHPDHGPGDRAGRRLRPGLLGGRARSSAVRPGRSPSPTASPCCRTPTAPSRPTSTRSTSSPSARRPARSAPAGATRALAGAAAEPAARHARGRLHLGRGGARRVHDRVAAQPAQPADRAAAGLRRPTRTSPSSSRCSRSPSPSCSFSSSAGWVRSAAIGAPHDHAPHPAAPCPSPSGGATVELVGVVKDYAGQRALDGVDLAMRARRVRRPARPVRLRQDHRPARAVRPRADRLRAASCIDGDDVVDTCRPTSATSAWCSSRTRCSRT